jgi:hypothetical protein
MPQNFAPTYLLSAAADPDRNRAATIIATIALSVLMQKVLLVMLVKKCTVSK